MSVLIPAFNAEATLGRAVRSVEGAAEIVVIDDGSSDGTAALGEALGARVIRHGLNRGSPAALATALRSATHEIVAFLDADDEWLPGKLAAQRPLLGPETAFVATGFETVDPAGRLLLRWGPEAAVHAGPDFWKALLAHSHVAKPSVLTRRSWIERAGGFNPALTVFEDQDMWIRLALMGPVAYIPEPCVRVHAGPAGLGARNSRADLRFVLPVVEQYLAQLGPRLTHAERRIIRRARYGAAARNLASQGAWVEALRPALVALANGEAPIPLLTELASKLVPVWRLRAG